MAVKRGATRLVILCGPYALKLPNPQTWRSFLNGLLANSQERDFSRLNDPRLCPVLWALPGGWALLMPRADSLSASEPLPEWDALPVEAKRDSFGRVRGVIVAVDYG